MTKTSLRTPLKRLKASPVLNFGHSDLFRISIFEFRILTHPCTDFNGNKWLERGSTEPPHIGPPRRGAVFSGKKIDK